MRLKWDILYCSNVTVTATATYTHYLILMETALEQRFPIYDAHVLSNEKIYKTVSSRNIPYFYIMFQNEVPVIVQMFKTHNVVLNSATI